MDGGFTHRLGQPREWHGHVGTGAGFIFDDAGANLLTEGRIGVYHDLVNPLVAMAGFQAELYAGARSARFDYGLRAQIVSPYLRVGAGFDINGLDRKPYFLLSLFHPMRRGGILGGGSLMRINYLPARDHSFSVGIEMPISRRINMGQTRPKQVAVALDGRTAPPTMYESPPPALITAIMAMRESALWIVRSTTPFLEQGAFGPDDLSLLDAELTGLKQHFDAFRSDSARWPTDADAFHARLNEAFSLASGNLDTNVGECSELGRQVADHARQVLLDEVIIPYNRLLGRVKEPDSLAGFGARARGVFIRWLHMNPRLPPEHIDANLWVFTQLIDILELARRWQHERWADSRFVWLPLQLTMRPEQHDSQAEMDALIEHVTNVSFTEGNRVWYVVNEQFPIQLSRTIHEARDYHVLWIHDIRGFDAGGDPDIMTYQHVLGAYLGALIKRAREYDRTGIFPVFMIFLDQWYYEVNRSRFWLELLEDPLHHEIELPAGFEAWADTIAARQAELREAVAQSRLLQDQAAQFGRAWLENLVRVNVSITNPADLSFWRRDMVPIWGMPDNVMRDHRKIAFFDITEEDPYRGGAIYTGAGVGEHYTTLNWEDRSLVVEGPALLTLKYAARDLLIDQGMKPEHIPWSLQPRPLAPDYATRIQAQVDTGHMNVRALDIHNQTGYNKKDLDVVKALLFTMMPAGSVAIVPDPLWSSGFWSGALVGHALRGGRTLIISPALANAPSTVMGGMARAREVLGRIMRARSVLGDVITDRGGILEVGVYSPSFKVTDLKGKLDAFRKTLYELPWYGQLVNFNPEVYAEFDRASESLVGYNERLRRTLGIEDQENSKLHLKAVFIASSEAWNALLHMPEWPEVFRVFLQKRAWQVENRDWALGRLDAPVPDVIDVGQPLLDRWIAQLPESIRERLIIYLMVGSPNQNYRSMLLDGEAALLVSGTSINAGLIDLVALTGQCHWIRSARELDPFYPDSGSIKLRIARWLKILL
jgi:hypothetical protein